MTKYIASVQNFCTIERQDITLAREHLLLWGKNGAGKTTLLTALAMLLSGNANPHGLNKRQIPKQVGDWGKDARLELAEAEAGSVASREIEITTAAELKVVEPILYLPELCYRDSIPLDEATEKLRRNKILESFPAAEANDAAELKRLIGEVVGTAIPRTMDIDEIVSWVLDEDVGWDAAAKQNDNTVSLLKREWKEFVAEAGSTQAWGEKIATTWLPDIHEIKTYRESAGDILKSRTAEIEADIAERNRKTTQVQQELVTTTQHHDKIVGDARAERERRMIALNEARAVVADEGKAADIEAAIKKTTESLERWKQELQSAKADEKSKGSAVEGLMEDLESMNGDVRAANKQRYSDANAEYSSQYSAYTTRKSRIEREWSQWSVTHDRLDGRLKELNEPQDTHVHNCPHCDGGLYFDDFEGDPVVRAYDKHEANLRIAKEIGEVQEELKAHEASKPEKVSEDPPTPPSVSMLDQTTPELDALKKEVKEAREDYSAAKSVREVRQQSVDDAEEKLGKLKATFDAQVDEATVKQAISQAELEHKSADQACEKAISDKKAAIDALSKRLEELKDADKIARLEEELETTRNAIKVFEAWLSSINKGKQINAHLRLAQFLAPSGYRAHRIADFLDPFLERLKFLLDLVGLPKSHLDSRDWTATVGGVPYQLLSASERWRFRLCMRIALIERLELPNPFIIVDEANVLTLDNLQAILGSETIFKNVRAIVAYAADAKPALDEKQWDTLEVL